MFQIFTIVAMDTYAAINAARNFWDVTFGNRSETSSGPQVAIAGAQCALRVTTLGVGILKLQSGKLDNERLKKVEGLIRASAVTRGLAL